MKKYGIILLFVLFIAASCHDRHVIINDSYIYGGNLLRDLFKEPFEKIIFIWPDMNYIIITDNDIEKINISILPEILKNTGLKLENCFAIYHNHLDISGFSQKDIRAYYWLKGMGFRGLFGIYYPHGNTIRLLIESKKNDANNNS
jgi:hypothetical protein